MLCITKRDFFFLNVGNTFYTDILSCKTARILKKKCLAKEICFANGQFKGPNCNSREIDIFWILWKYIFPVTSAKWWWNMILISSLGETSEYQTSEKKKSISIQISVGKITYEISTKKKKKMKNPKKCTTQ